MIHRARLHLCILATVALVAQVAPLPTALATDEVHLAQNVTDSSPAHGESVSLDSLDGFSPGGGEAIFDPGNAFAETSSYAGTDPGTNSLTGLDRPDPKGHPSGAVVQPTDASAPSPSPSSEPPPAPAPTDGGSTDGSSTNTG